MSRNGINGNEINGVSFPLTESGYSIVTAVASASAHGTILAGLATSGFSSTVDCSAESTASCVFTGVLQSSASAEASSGATRQRVDWYPRGTQTAQATSFSTFNGVLYMESVQAASAVPSASNRRHISLHHVGDVYADTEGWLQNELMVFRSSASAAAVSPRTWADKQFSVSAGAIFCTGLGTGLQVLNLLMHSGIDVSAECSGYLVDYNTAISADDDAIIYVPEDVREMRVTA